MLLDLFFYLCLMEKYLIFFIIFIILYYLHNCWIENLIKKETFADTPASGMDDSTAIQALGAIAKDLMSGGGLKVQGNSSFAGTLAAKSGIELTNKWGMYDTGDDWIRINKIDKKGTNDYYGGIAMSKGSIITPDFTVAGRNILAELDDLKAKIAALDGSVVKYDQQFKMSVTSDRIGAAGGGTMIGACGGACGGGATMTATTDPNRQLGLKINRW